MGSWAWVCLLLRALLFVFSSIYKVSLLDQPIIPRRLPQAVCIELQMAVYLLPLMQVNLQLGYADRIYATDVSLQVAGVTYGPFFPYA